MKPATLKQASYLLDMLRQKNISSTRLQSLIDSGLLADLLESKPEQINRMRFRQLLTLEDVFYPVKLDSGRSWRQMFDAAQLSKECTVTEDKFRMGKCGGGTFHLELVRFPDPRIDQILDLTVLVQEFDSRGLLFPCIEHVFAFAAEKEYREELRHCIIAVFSPCRGPDEIIQGISIYDDDDFHSPRRLPYMRAVGSRLYRSHLYLGLRRTSQA